MILRIAADLVLTLEAPSDFKRFKVLVDRPERDFQELSIRHGKVLRFQDAKTAWVNAAGLVAFSGLADDAVWRGSFESMLHYCKRMDWLSEDGREFRAHVEWIS